MLLFANARNDARNYFFDGHCVDVFIQILEADSAAAGAARAATKPFGPQMTRASVRGNGADMATSATRKVPR
jgi:hypothetical protein